MSYFDGVIPKACRHCFSWDGHKWVRAEPSLCDGCTHMLDMFPPTGTDELHEWERWDQLAAMEEPTWTIAAEIGPQDQYN